LQQAGAAISFEINNVRHGSELVWKSDDCVNNAHGLCKGFTKEDVDDFSTNTKMCTCPCHDGMYQLVRNTVALVNQSARSNPFQFSAGDDP
jgi:hypothetical protein